MLVIVKTPDEQAGERPGKTSVPWFWESVPWFWGMCESLLFLFSSTFNPIQNRLLPHNEHIYKANKENKKKNIIHNSINLYQAMQT